MEGPVGRHSRSASDASILTSNTYNYEALLPDATWASPHYQSDDSPANSPKKGLGKKPVPAGNAPTRIGFMQQFALQNAREGLMQRLTKPQQQPAMQQPFFAPVPMQQPAPMYHVHQNRLVRPGPAQRLADMRWGATAQLQAATPLQPSAPLQAGTYNWNIPQGLGPFSAAPQQPMHQSAVPAFRE